MGGDQLSGSVTTWLVVACGAVVGIGALLVLVALARRPRETVEAPGDDDDLAPGAVDGQPGAGRGARGRWSVVAAVGAAVAGWLITGWPVAGPLAALTVWFWPLMVGGTRQHEERVTRSDAIATWTGHLVGSVRAASGLQQALVRSAPLAPAAIAPVVRRLAARLRAGQRTQEALRHAQTDLDDATGDLVMIALGMAAQHADGLADCLEEIRVVARDDADLRRDTHANRARARTAVRVVLGSSAAMVAIMLFAFPSYLTAYRSVAGQLALVVIAAGYAACLWWIRRVADIPDEPRILVSGPTPGSGGQRAARRLDEVTPMVAWSQALGVPAIPLLAAAVGGTGPDRDNRDRGRVWVRGTDRGGCPAGCAGCVAAPSAAG
ncbi:type II secretion system F family protein [Fodinicola feengrottensis]|uniref:type II secretion system F family protein n=1 Tax=Fodinicola feengrottensis TaxID=435914 RepID=UPI0013D24514|nr:type II secretion system F family protein [Fodinicola feengrottensis]